MLEQAYGINPKHNPVIKDYQLHIMLSTIISAHSFNVYGQPQTTSQISSLPSVSATLLDPQYQTVLKGWELLQSFVSVNSKDSPLGSGLQQYSYNVILWWRCECQRWAKRFPGSIFQLKQMFTTGQNRFVSYTNPKCLVCPVDELQVDGRPGAQQAMGLGFNVFCERWHPNVEILDKLQKMETHWRQTANVCESTSVCVYVCVWEH